MKNPIIQALNMSSGNNWLKTVMQIKQMLSNQNPGQVLQQMAQSNPQFADFVRKNQGKTPEQIASDYGVDFNLLREILK